MVSCRYVVVSLTLHGPDEYGTESFQYEDKTAWTVPLQRVAGMGNEREQELGQFGSVTGPTKALEMLNDGSSFESARVGFRRGAVLVATDVLKSFASD